MARSKKLIFYSLIIVILTIIVSLWVARNSLLNAIIKKKLHSIESQYNADIKYQSAYFNGIKTITINNITVIKTSDTLAKIESLNTTLSLSKLLTFRIYPSSINVNNGKVNLVIRKNKKTLNISGNKTHAGKGSFNILNRILKGIFKLAPTQINIENLILSMSDSLHTEKLIVKSWQNREKNIAIDAVIIANGTTQSIAITGNINNANRSIELLLNKNLAPVTVPFIQLLTGIQANVNGAKILVQEKNVSRNSSQFFVKCNSKKLSLNSCKLAPNSVNIDSLQILLSINLQPNHLVIDSSSTVKVNDLSANIYADISNNSTTSINLKVKTPQIKWQHFINDMPEGLFNTIDKLKIKGSFDYNLQFKLDLDNPDSLYLTSKLVSKDFKIEDFGDTRIAAINDTFTYKIVENDSITKPIFLGEKNSKFTPLSKISPFLTWAVITSEDGSFFYHKGFDPEGIKHAIACNLKENRFARGGSTITQQMVKNIFLNQNKNVSRKLEEMLIVWMIENGNILSKERILEIYLNIIEWGPNVNGIAEAAQFYFSKKPSELTLKESLFLAYIIPRPAKYKYLFDKPPCLKPFMQEYFKHNSEVMLSRGNITPEDIETMVPDSIIVLKGKATNVFTDSTTVISNDLK